MTRGEMSRRDFLKLTGTTTLACACGAWLGATAEDAQAAPRPRPGWREAEYYRTLGNGRVQCTLCPCAPDPPKRGVLVDRETCVCRVRTNVGGKLYVTNYGRAASLHLDPIEKNPSYHFLPGAQALALSAPGCTLACKCCQNWQMSQVGTHEIRTIDAPPEEIIRRAAAESCRAITYTYTDAAAFFEYARDTAKLAQSRGLANTMVTGGYINPDPLKQLCRYVDAFSISVKGFTEDYYRDNCRGQLSTVLDAMKTVKSQGRWLEVVVLVIPTMSDDISKIKWLSGWISDTLGADTPVHFSRFWPAYRFKNLPQTPVSTLERARQVARGEGLRYVYIGNLPGHAASNTYCPRCGKVLLRRVGFRITEDNMKGGRCKFCGAGIPGRWA
ncbi:MAG: AmmeMemoRadiSam system radical SAM enzyme [Armatimonadota bacterium]|nr:MAG: AmmeMemoRadiSam system radical SAM enzyme [Armatimonadota bacterium]